MYVYGDELVLFVVVSQCIDWICVCLLFVLISYTANHLSCALCSVIWMTDWMCFAVSSASLCSVVRIYIYAVYEYLNSAIVVIQPAHNPLRQ